MQFHDFDSMVEDPCCVEVKINIHNPLPVHIGGFLGNGWDKGSGGSNRDNTVLVGAPGVRTESSVLLKRARKLTFWFPKAPQTCL
jgi:hypothetical protein